MNNNPVINPENFNNDITNLYFQLDPGKTYTYTAQAPDGLETVVVFVLTETKQVAGVICAVVRDVVGLDGVMIEDTYDWCALEPDAPLEYKYYAPGIGNVKEETEGTGEVLELIIIE